MTLLSKDQILTASKRKKQEVCAFGGKVSLMEMTGNMRDEYESYIISNRKNGSGIKMIRATLLSFCIVDDDGNRIFNDSEIDQLGNQPVSQLQKLYDVAVKLNSLSEEDIEELEGNSESVLSESSTTS